LVLYPNASDSSPKTKIPFLSTPHNNNNNNSGNHSPILYEDGFANSNGQYSNIGATRRGILHFTSQLKAGKGLTLIAECISGKYTNMADQIPASKKILSDHMRKHKIRGFCDVLVADNYDIGVSCLIQT